MADPAAAEKEKDSKSEAQKRIDELTKRNKELENLVNMKKRVDDIESTVDLAVRNQQAQLAQVKEPEDEGGWGKFLSPKVAPIIEKIVAPLKGAIFQLADENDKLKTMLAEPKFRDPEIEAEVEGIRKQRFHQTGQVEPRANVITFLKGQNPDRFKEEDKTARREEAEGTHIETGAGVGGSRADSRRDAGLTTNSSIEEMEKWFQEHPEDGKLL